MPPDGRARRWLIGQGGFGMDRLIVLAHRDLHSAQVAVDRPGVAQRLRWSLGAGAGKVFGKRGRRGQRELGRADE